ncbi:BlaI/MecI/CopY family transcriptional regulator [Candidatus Micrarchaeota archaeon]|nr:BlaI/MecI/CopY family transcriptional regulator [Candidatus Micrarchaeota archaeon]
MPSNQFSLEELKNSLSETEVKILDILRSKEETNSAFIYGALKKKHGVARSSVPVLLERLHSKGLVKRRKETCRGGMRYLYSLNGCKENYYKSLVESVVNKMIDKFGNVAVSYFNERFSKKDD